MRTRITYLLRLMIALFDVFTINLTFIVTFILFHKNHLVENEVQYFYFLVLLNIAWIAVTIYVRLYNRHVILSFEEFSKKTAAGYFIFLLPVVISLFFFRMFLLSRIFITAIFLLIPAALFINRFIYSGIVLHLQKGQGFINRILILGYNSLSKKVTQLLEEDGIEKQIVGYCEEYENVHELSNYPILNSIANTMLVCEQYGVTEIYSTIAPEQNSIVYKLMQKADESCIRFKIVPDLGIFIKKRMHIDQLKGMPVISMRKEPLEVTGNRIKKRLFDVLISSFVIAFILSWLTPLISLLIWIETRCSVFFIQERNGKNNKIFRCIKFKSMYKNDDAHVKQATRDDKRITKVGAFLRRTSLDEFPQFFNVFKGEMSVVGPRPHMIKHTNEYSRSVDNYMVRQFLKPGITGWAQINGCRGETQTVLDMERRVQHDLWYLENWSLMLDIRIIFMTVINAIKGDKNAF